MHYDDDDDDDDDDDNEDDDDDDDDVTAHPKSSKYLHPLNRKRSRSIHICLEDTQIACRDAIFCRGFLFGVFERRGYPPKDRIQIHQLVVKNIPDSSLISIGSLSWNPCSLFSQPTKKIHLRKLICNLNRGGPRGKRKTSRNTFFVAVPAVNFADIGEIGDYL